MTKKLTAIQTLIQDMEALKKTKLYENSFKAIDDCIALAYAQLDDEKNQILEAHKQNRISTIYINHAHNKAIGYFKQTYK